jgi:hypothetical protein
MLAVWQRSVLAYQPTARKADYVTNTGRGRKNGVGWTGISTVYETTLQPMSMPGSTGRLNSGNRKGCGETMTSP